MKIDIENVPATADASGRQTGGGFIWILETDSGELIPGKSSTWADIWESCRKLNNPAVDQRPAELLNMS